MRDLLLLSLLLTAIEATATIAFALSGLLEAARKRLDAVGVCVVAGPVTETWPQSSGRLTVRIME